MARPEGMRVRFVGVGEAVDENYGNTSILLESAKGDILLDCGFTAGHDFFRHAPDPDNLDGVWISHFHGDHFMGLPALCLRLRVAGRTRPLTIAGGPGAADKVHRALELAYESLLKRPPFAIEVKEAAPGDVLELGPYTLRTTLGGHPEPCLAVLAELDGRSAFYSGDGHPTPETVELAAGCDLAIQEAYGLDESTEGHGSLDMALDFASRASAARLAVVHMRREDRALRADEARARLAAASVPAMLPEPGDVIDLP